MRTACAGLRHVPDACGGKRYWQPRLGWERLDVEVKDARIDEGVARQVLRVVEKRRETPPQRMGVLVGSFPDIEWRELVNDSDVVIVRSGGEVSRSV